MQPKVGVIMGSRSDWPTMEHAVNMLEKLGVAYETRVVSAHRTPDLLFDYAKSAADRGLQVIIAGAGGAAHLPGMVASQTALPVLGVPVESKALSGMDSLLSIVQMPGGVPVGTLRLVKQVQPMPVFLPLRLWLCRMPLFARPCNALGMNRPVMLWITLIHEVDKGE